MTDVERLAAFVAGASYDDLSGDVRAALQARVLDAIGCAIGALEGPPVAAVRAHVEALAGRPTTTLIGGGKTTPDHATLYNSALVRYLDFNDSYLAKGETCHPSDNLGAVLAATEHAGRGGQDLLVALAIAYQIQCRLSEAAPVRAKGFDHTTQGAYAAAAGVARAMGLGPQETAHAIAMSGTASNALRITRTGRLSHWKGLAYAATATMAVHAALLASRGITGPLELLEGSKGFHEVISGPFTVDWTGEPLDRVLRTILKRYNAEVHAQSTLEGVLELRDASRIDPATVERVDVEIFDVAYHIIGGGEEGNKHRVETKEEADHSLPYLVAAALIDGDVGPAQYDPQRIRRDDVQRLLRRVAVRPDARLSRGFPDEMPVRIRIALRDRSPIETLKSDYEGFHTRPMSWDRVVAKFNRLAAPYAEPGVRTAIVDAVARLETLDVRALTEPLARVSVPPRAHPSLEAI